MCSGTYWKEAIEEEDEDTEEDPWDRPDAYEQWVMVEFAEVIREVSGLVHQLIEDEDAKIGRKYISQILAKRGFNGMMRRIWKHIHQKEGWKRACKNDG